MMFYSNLFSSFDPSTSKIVSLNWISTVMFMILMPYSFRMMTSMYNKMMETICMKMNQKFKTMFSENKMMTLMFVSIFMIHLINNMMGLLTYIFTSSSHLVFTLMLALPMWLSIMLFGWINKTQSMFAHLIPEGTPTMLMPFMVCIETISNIIRPGSLSVRLTANMIAGHLLMSLLSNNTSSNVIIMTSLIMIQMMLMLFETAESIIQAYVFFNPISSLFKGSKLSQKITQIMCGLPMLLETADAFQTS